MLVHLTVPDRTSGEGQPAGDTERQVAPKAELAAHILRHTGEAAIQLEVVALGSLDLVALERETHGGSDARRGMVVLALEKIVGAKEVEGWGGRVVRVPLFRDKSTTKLVQQLRGGG